MVSFGRLPRVVFMVGVLACLLANPLAVNASTLRYTGTGGAITGTLNGTPFTNATWSITGTGDPTNVVSGTASGVVPFYFLAVSPRLTITTGSSTLEATLTSGTTGWQVGVLSGDYGVLVAGLAATGFTYLQGVNQPSFFALETAGTSGLYNDLQSPFFGLGTQNTNADATYYTDIGLLQITALNSGPSSFSITAVPEPSAYAMALAGLACGGSAMFRRRRGR